MRTLRGVGLLLALLSCALLVGSAQAGPAKPQLGKAKQTTKPVWTLAMDGPRVAYASAGRVYVWNVATGATSVVKGRYSNATHSVNAAEIAISGRRVAWIKREGFGNTEQSEKLYSAPLAGKAQLLKQAHLFGGREDPCYQTGGRIAGLVGSGTVLAVSSWKPDRTDPATDQKLSLITAGGLRPIVTGPAAIVSAVAGGGHIAVVPLGKPSPQPEGYCNLIPSTTVRIYSTSGTLLHELELNTAGEMALSGNRLVVLTPSPTPALDVYDWTTGVLVHTWPVVGAGLVRPANVAAYGRLIFYSVYTGYVGGGERVHLLDPSTGKDVVVANVRGYGSLHAWAIGPRGLVYVVNHGSSQQPHGRLVFVPMAKLLAATR